MTSVGQALRVVGSGCRTQWRLSRVSPLAVITNAVGPVAYGAAITAGYGRPSPGLLLGAMAAGLWSALMIEPTVIVVNERSWGTLQSIAATPTSVAWPLIGRLIGSCLTALFCLPAIVIGMLLIFARSVPGMLAELGRTPAGLLAGAFAVTVVGLFGMSMVLMGVLIRFRYSAGMVNGLFGLMILLGGFFVPLEILPVGLEAVGRAIPAAWAVDALRQADSTTGPVELVLGAGLAVAWCVLGAFLMGRSGRALQRSPLAYSHG
jgi:ABC-type multidrug transport system permease subunit